MATDLEVRFCTTPSTDRLPLSALTAVLDAVQSTVRSHLAFTRFRVSTVGSPASVHEQRGHLDSAALITALERWNLPIHSITATTALTRYVLDQRGVTMDKTSIPLRITCAGGESIGRTGNWWLDGDIRLSIPTAVPFSTPTDGRGEPVERLDNQRNMAILSALLLTVTKTMKPLSFKLYTDAGEFFPFNAHLAYFAQPEEALRDITLIKELYLAGSSVLQLPPLGQLRGDLADFAFHLWRNPRQRDRVRHRLGQAVELDRPADIDSVLSAATTEAFVLESVGSGFTISHGRYPLNSFLDGFYESIFRGC